MSRLDDCIQAVIGLMPDVVARVDELRDEVEELKSLTSRKSPVYDEITEEQARDLLREYANYTVDRVTAELTAERDGLRDKVSKIEAERDELLGRLGAERQRCAGIVKWCREESVTDLRHVLHWIESGEEVPEMPHDTHWRGNADNQA